MDEDDQMQELTCSSCGEVLAIGRDTDGDLTEIKIICVCKNVNTFQFIGYPQLCGTNKYYFDFTDEFELTSNLR